MTPNSPLRTMPSSKILYLGILLTGAVAYALLSPKWVIPVLAWVAPGCLLFYFCYARLRFKNLWFTIALIVAQMVSAYGVFPFPWPVMAILTIINTAKLLLVFSVYYWVSKKSNRFIVTLVFPALYVSKEFLDTIFGGGTWWSIANSQYSFSWLTQLSSVTGLAGISFIVYWFASVAVWAINQYYQNEKPQKGMVWYGGALALVLLFGITRFYTTATENKKQVKVAGLSAPTFSFMEAVYKDVYGQSITIDPTISQSSKQLQQVNTALVPFIENPDTAKFVHGYKALRALHDSLFALSLQAVNKGAKIIAWSEANAIMPRPMQDAFIQRGVAFAKTNSVYLLMALGVFDSGKITATKMFLENKTIFVSPDGEIVNVFHKNHPVPYAEHSVPGDGKIPVIATPYGRLSVSICYDADIPMGMGQLAQNKSDVLFLPSGDWYAIAPYHSYIAMFRGIENGCAVVRPASGGLSLVTDYRGKTQASFDFYKPGEKLWLANISFGHVFTIYSVIGDAFAYVCILISGVALVYLVVSAVHRKKRNVHAGKEKQITIIA